MLSWFKWNMYRDHIVPAGRPKTPLSTARRSHLRNTWLVNLGSCISNTFRNKVQRQKQAKLVKLATLHNKSKLMVEVSTVTVLKRAMWKWTNPAAIKSDLMQGFYLGVPRWSQHLRLAAETVDPRLPPSAHPPIRHLYASSCVQELLPFIQGAYAWAFFYDWALLHSSVSGWSMVQGGRLQKHWSISVPSSVLSPHFPSSSSSFLLSSFYIWLRCFCFLLSIHGQVHTSIVLSRALLRCCGELC